MDNAPIIDFSENILPMMKQEETTEDQDTLEVSHCLFFKWFIFML